VSARTSAGGSGTITASERAELASIALLVAEEAGELVSGGYRTRPRVDYKGHQDLVTEFDRSSQDLLVSRLASLSPGLPIIAEERSSPERDREGRRGLAWHVDPIDGTTNFIHGHPFWCIAVGLMENEEPIAGAVVAPMLGLRWVGWVVPERATRGGALPAEGPGTAFRSGKHCAVSTTACLSDALIATGFPAIRDHAPANNFDSFVSVKRMAQAVRRCGSAAIDLCMVADGTYDGYWERGLKSWDTVAASAIVLAAGGVITALNGGSPNYHIGHVIASNGLVHDELLAILHGNGNAEGGHG
jgi:myo-inositol-1(or 4)-monophosphatase